MDWTWWPAAGEAAFDGGWNAFPGVWVCVAVLGLAMLRWQRGREDRADHARRRRLFAIAGWLTLWLALDWPVGALAAGELLSARTAQYLLLTFATVPLLLLGLSPTRATISSRRIRAMNALSHPAVTLPVFAIVLGATHLPGLVDAMAARPAGVFAVNVAWLSAATVFWWRIVGPEPDARRMPYLGVLAYLVAPFLLTKVPGLVFVFREEPLYASFSAAPATLGLSAQVDQHIAGFLLWIVGSMLIVGALAVLFFRWQAEDRRMSLSDNLAVPVDPRALELLFAVPGAWTTLEAVVAGISERLPAGPHGAELAFAYRERPGAEADTQVILELHIALDSAHERVLARHVEHVVSECLGRLQPGTRAAVARRFAFRLVTYGTRVG